MEEIAAAASAGVLLGLTRSKECVEMAVAESDKRARNHINIYLRELHGLVKGGWNTLAHTFELTPEGIEEWTIAISSHDTTPFRLNARKWEPAVAAILGKAGYVSVVAIPSGPVCIRFKFRLPVVEEGKGLDYTSEHYDMDEDSDLVHDEKTGLECRLASRAALVLKHHRDHAVHVCTWKLGDILAEGITMLVKYQYFGKREFLLGDPLPVAPGVPFWTYRGRNGIENSCQVSDVGCAFIARDLMKKSLNPIQEFMGPERMRALRQCILHCVCNHLISLGYDARVVSETSKPTEDPTMVWIAHAVCSE
jgi:hypothetical protein